MKYQSTRGGCTGSTFEDALFSGYAPDGGIYVPSALPTIPPELLTTWKESPPTYQQVVFEIVKLFVDEDEIPRDVLQQSIKLAYAEFDVESVVGLRDCRGATDSVNYTVAEMYRGKTKSFKDYALSLVGRLMEYFVQKRKTHVTILVGTSGDTGSAAIEAVRGLQGIDIIVLYPKGRISEVQELQMITVPEENVHVFQTEGTSDDLDIPIKKCFPAPCLISINSINWARIMIQVAHHVYLCTLEHCTPVDIYVPTGAAGNLVSGLVASFLGFPINLFCAQNDNNNVETLINKGVLSFGGRVLETYSNAMDIRNPYNVERILYFLSSDPEMVSNIVTQAENSPGTEVRISKEIHEKLKKHIGGAMKVDTPTTLSTVADCWKINKYLICPHTATALTFFLRNRTSTDGTLTSNKSYVIATASPEKFPDSVKAAKISADVDAHFDSSKGEKRKLLDVLKERKRIEPKLMSREQDWFKILQEEINLIRERSS